MTTDFVAGMKEGVRRYAWWKDGEQYVGDGRHTLEQALEKIDEDFKHVEEVPGGVQFRYKNIDIMNPKPVEEEDSGEG